MLYLAVKLDCEKLTELLIENGFDISDEKNSPLHWAARWGSLRVAELLLEKGISVDVQNSSGETPLHFAIRHGSKNEEIVKFLIQKRANVNAEDQEGFAPLHCAAYYKAIEIVRSLLEGQAITDVQNKYGETPLRCAAEHRYAQIVEALLKGGVGADVQDKNGETPLHATKNNLNCATESEQVQVVTVLLQGKAKVDLQDEKGKTPLHYAAERGHTQIAKVLLKRGANVDAQDKGGQTPLSYEGGFNSKITKLLLDHGADPSRIHKPRAIIMGIIVGTLAAIITPLVLVCTTALPALAIIGITVASALIVGRISYGVAYKSSEHSLNSTLSRVSCNTVGNETTVNL
ncbi:ankyrin repeat domain-containing protein [Wolbachia pipientis]|uniref:ankyrin repeat domain-containing protein n=1 Tax=Wolbachia pipientis TaxID=955 RepID=UPI00202E2349|nr:ankyrin repeat domain-containing protein [Wolbachia pipientis]MCM1002151.1 ankyrin repeat domain-containing protein [Wolbachia pipientis]